MCKWRSLLFIRASTRSLIVMQDCQLKESLLQQAAEKLRSSIQFSRADPAPHNALGDVLMDAAELAVNLAGGPDAAAAAVSGGAGPAPGAAGFGGAAPLPSAAAEQAAALIKQAVDDGYMAALTINRTNADALVSIFRPAAPAAPATGYSDATCSPPQRPAVAGSSVVRALCTCSLACSRQHVQLYLALMHVCMARQMVAEWQLHIRQAKQEPGHSVRSFE